MTVSNHQTIAVETMASQYARAGLNRVAEILSEEGYQVVRWQGPYARRFKFVASTIPPCDAAVIWNGLKPRYQLPVKTLRREKIPFLLMEVGWHPQKGTYQLDWQGINTDASWVSDLLQQKFPKQSPIQLSRLSSDLLVVMQNDADSQITHYSPHFKNMEAFLRFLIDVSKLPLRVRFHPRHPPGYGLRKLIRKNRHRLVIDQSNSLSAALDTAVAVACVNSSSAVEAMQRGVPVLCFGDAIYRVPDAVYCLSDDSNAVNQVTQSLLNGQCDLGIAAVEKVVSAIECHQLSLDELRIPLLRSIQSILQ